MQGVLARMHFRIFLIPIGYLETNIKYAELYFFFFWFECEVVSLKVFGKHKPRVFENMVPRRTFEPKRK